VRLKIYDNSLIRTNNKTKPNEIVKEKNKKNIWNLWVWIQIVFTHIIRIN